MGDRSNGGGREGRVGKGKSLTYNDRILDTPLFCYIALLVVNENFTLRR